MPNVASANTIVNALNYFQEKYLFKILWSKYKKPAAGDFENIWEGISPFPATFQLVHIYIFSLSSCD